LMCVLSIAALAPSFCYLPFYCSERLLSVLLSSPHLPSRCSSCATASTFARDSVPPHPRKAGPLPQQVLSRPHPAVSRNHVCAGYAMPQAAPVVRLRRGDAREHALRECRRSLSGKKKHTLGPQYRFSLRPNNLTSRFLRITLWLTAVIRPFLALLYQLAHQCVRRQCPFRHREAPGLASTDSSRRHAMSLAASTG